MKRRVVNVSWENEDFQECFAEWVPFPDALASAEDVDRIEAAMQRRGDRFAARAFTEDEIAYCRNCQCPERRFGTPGRMPASIGRRSPYRRSRARARSVARVPGCRLSTSR